MRRKDQKKTKNIESRQGAKAQSKDENGEIWFLLRPAIADFTPSDL